MVEFDELVMSSERRCARSPPSDPCQIHTCMSELHHVLCARSKRTKTTNIAKANDSEREKMREKRISKLESDANDDAGNDDVDDDDDFDVRLSISSGRAHGIFVWRHG